jgi:hypothetical protein
MIFSLQKKNCAEEIWRAAGAAITRRLRAKAEG